MNRIFVRMCMLPVLAAGLWLAGSSAATAQSSSYYGAPYRHNSYGDNGPHGSIQATVDAWWNDWKKHWPDYEHCGYSFKLLDPKTNGGKVVSMSPGSPCSGTAYGFATEYSYNPDKNQGPPSCQAPGTHCGNPINVTIGNKYQREDDIEPVAGLAFYRHYNSLAFTDDGHIGKKWTHNYDFRLKYMIDSLGAKTMALIRPDGNRVVFNYVSGQWQADADVYAKVVQHNDASGAISGWTYTPRDGREVEQYDKLGRLFRVERSDGSLLDFTYNNAMPVSGTESDYLLTRIQTESGRSLVLQYDTNLRVVSVYDVANQEYRYGYDPQGRLVSVTYPDNKQRLYHYNEAAYTNGADLPYVLTGITHEDGRRYATFTYGTDARALSSEHAGGVDKFTAQYGSGTTTTVTTPNGSTQTRSFSTILGVKKAASISEQCADCASRTIAYAYDANGYLDTKTDPRGAVSDYDYNARGLLTHVAEAKSASGSLRTVDTDWHADWAAPIDRRTYDAAQALVVSQHWTYNARGQEVTRSETDPATNQVRTTTSAYCEPQQVVDGVCPRVGLLTSVDGPRTDVVDATSYVYYPADAADCASSPSVCSYRKGDLWKVVDASGATNEILRYDAVGRILSSKDSNGVVTDREYTIRGWLSKIAVRGAVSGSEADDRIVLAEYWPTGDVKTLTTADGAITNYVYDAAARLTDVLDGDGNKIHYTYDLAGNRIKEDTLAVNGDLKRTLSRVFDGLSRLRADKDASQNATAYRYDAGGNRDKTTDALGRATDQTYDPLNRLVRTLQDVGGLNVETKFEYDALDRLTKVTDPKGLNTVYAYNGFGDQTRLTSPDTGITDYTYNPAGRVATKQDANDAVPHRYTYDALGRPKAVFYTASGPADVEYDYDTVNSICAAGETFATGRVTAMRADGTELKYCYDRFGQVARKVQIVAGKSFNLSYTYTLGGQLSTVTYPDGATVDYVRDAQARIKEIGVKPNGGVRAVLLSNATYEPSGPMAGWTYGNGRVLSRTYDLDYRAKTILDNASGGLSLGYGYNTVGELTELKDGLQSAFQAKYDYDTLGRLTVTRDGSSNPLETYTYDETGNRKSLLHGGVTDTYVYPADSHHLSGVAGVARGYDATGNTITIGSADKEFVYSANDRLSQFKRGGIVKASYRYNALGERVAITGAVTSTIDTYTVYDETGNWIGDYDSTGAAKQQAVWLIGEPVGLVVGNGGTQSLLYVEPDHLGAPRAVIDSGRNVAIWTWDAKSEVFGSSLPNQDADLDGTAFVFNMRFPGQRFDAASGLAYNYFRDYDPATGRYLQSDPIGLNGGISTYAYVSGNPVSRIDPFGLKDYTACETRALLDEAKADMSAPLVPRTTNALRNHGGLGRFDFKMNQPNDTFVAPLVGKLSAAEFGNFIAGYSGIYYGGRTGLALVIVGGVLLDATDAMGGSGTFDMDADSIKDIHNGAVIANMEVNGSPIAQCGCSN
ncbi:RHS repeat protein [Lysobacter sp. K5869]|uniref:RHS repeat-associated core domain-containing protein n=1 Tax=Lysobacter sp. K5869 TaxID=2820808 RepID=UPI001C063E4A|nr:RHS repeat-associated core domain-containing protein [Lysobacter sp. K5869]QWP78179.1 RHS repeat protein [Lysobacter sp. K5869]